MEPVARARSKSPKRRSKSPKTSKISQEQLLATLRKKQECNSKAQAIVEKFLSTEVKNEDLLTSLKFINQSHFDDIVQERSIEKLCGWVLCNSEIKDAPKQQFKINLTSKKVFDITERKLFCSGNCYKQAMYLKEQILTSPLWLRDTEVIPEFKLLALDED